MADVTAIGSGGAGLGTRAARWALSVVWALGLMSEAMQSAGAAPSPWRLLAYAASLVGAVVLTTPGDHSLSRTRVIVIDAAALVTVWSLLASGPAVERLWLVDFSSYVAALLIARGNAIGGAVGAALVIGSAGGWAIAVDGFGPQLVNLVITPLLAVAVGFIWRAALARMVAQERLHRSDGARALHAAQLAEEAAAADERDLAEIRREAGRLLAELAQGHAIDESTRREAEVVEANIRDRIRSPWILSPELVATIDDRRRTGVSVVLLGELPGPRADIAAELGSALVRIVADAQRGSVTVRASPPGRAAAVSVLLDDGIAPSRLILLDAHGAPLPEPAPPVEASGGHQDSTTRPSRNSPAIS